MLRSCNCYGLEEEEGDIQLMCVSVWKREGGDKRNECTNLHGDIRWEEDVQ